MPEKYKPEFIKRAEDVIKSYEKQAKLGEQIVPDREKALEEKVAEGQMNESELAESRKREDLMDGIDPELFRTSDISLEYWGKEHSGDLNSRNPHKISGNITGTVGGKKIKIQRMGGGGTHDSYSATIDGRGVAGNTARELWIKYIDIAFVKTWDTEQTAYLESEEGQADRDSAKLL